MKTCVMSANCQGELVKNILNRLEPFSQEWEIKYYVNFHKTPIPEGEIENCDLLLYQRLGEEWGDLSSDVLLSRVPKEAKTLCLPNMTNYSLWPTATWAPEAYNLWLDSYVEDLIARKLSYSEIIYVVMRADFSKILDLPMRTKESLLREYGKDYYGRANIFKFIEQNWKEKQLFTTPNHPAKELMILVVNLVLEVLGIPSIKVSGDLSNITCDKEFFLPVHPFYIEHYEIQYLTESTRYPVFGNSLTYKEYLMAYVAARQQEIPLLRYFEELKK